MKKYLVTFTWKVRTLIEVTALDSIDAETQAIELGERLNDSDGVYVADSLDWHVVDLGGKLDSPGTTVKKLYTAVKNS